MPQVGKSTSRFVVFAVAVVCLVHVSCMKSGVAAKHVVLDNQHSANYDDQLIALRMAALKGFNGKIFYIGSNLSYDYFTVEKYKRYFRVKRGNVKLPRMFNLGYEDPYEVGFDIMIRKSNI